MKYTTFEIKEVEIDVDFQKLYDYISSEDHTDDINIIGEDFGDNFQYYMWQALGIEMDNGFFGRIPSEFDSRYLELNDLEDKICDDFNEWLVKNKK